MEAELPILIIEGLDVLAFASLEGAQRHLEPWWVQEKRGEVFDARGHRLAIACDGQRVTLDLDGERAPVGDELHAMLRAHFRAAGKSKLDDQTLNLSQLVAALDVSR